jgi:hypothetical protein
MDTMIVLTFGAGFLLCVVVDYFHYRKQIGDAYEVGAIDGAMAVMNIVNKHDPKLMKKLETEVLTFNKGKVL